MNDKIIHKIKTHKSLMELIKYSLVGLLNLIIDVLIVNILMNIFKIYKGPILMIFNAISFCFYSVIGYTLNKHFTFKCKDSSYLGYATVLGFSILIESPLFMGLTMFNFFNVNKILWANICKIISFTIGGILCFLISKYRIFKEKKD